MATRNPDHTHRYQRLNDDQLFCECGKTKTVNPRQKAITVAPPVILPQGCCHRHHCWCGEHHYYHPTWQPYWSPTIWASGTTSIGAPVEITSVTYSSATDQYTLAAGDGNVNTASATFNRDIV